MSSPGCEKSAVACAYDFFSEEKVASGHQAEDTRDKADCSEENEDKSSTGRGEGKFKRYFGEVVLFGIRANLARGTRWFVLLGRSGGSSAW